MVEIVPALDYGTTAELRRVYRLQRLLSDDEQERLDDLEAQCSEISEMTE